MKISILFFSFLFLSSGQVAKASECEKEASLLVGKYVRLMDEFRGVKEIAELDFKNTTPGSYNQKYEGRFNLKMDLNRVHENKVLKFYFTSPFICEELRISRVVKN